MKPTAFNSKQSGLVGAAELRRARAGSRPRHVMPPEPVILVGLGDEASAVDAGWAVWRASLGVRVPAA